MISKHSIFSVAILLLCTAVATAQTPQTYPGRGGRGAGGRGGRGTSPATAQSPRPQSSATVPASSAALPAHGIFVYSNLCTSTLAVQGYRIVLIRIADGDYVYLRAGTGPSIGQAGYNVSMDADNFVFFFDNGTSGSTGFGKPNVFRGKISASQITATVGDPLASTPPPSVTLKRLTDFDAPMPNC